MSELKCAVVNCVNNQEHCCCKGDIKIDGKEACKCDDTCCDSFQERRDGNDSYANALNHPKQVVCIDCDAINCAYNSNYKCVADHVDIKGCGASDCRETACATFTEK